MTLVAIAEFIAKSDLKKATLGVYFWTSLILAKAKFPELLPAETVGELLMLIIVAVFAGNVLTHLIQKRYAAKGSKLPIPAEGA
jgi:hypothetical protein